MGALSGFLADVFFRDDGGLPSPALRDLTDAYRAEFPGFSGDRVLVLFDWEPSIRHALHAFKYDGARAVGASLALRLAAHASGSFGRDAVVTWVPGRPFQYFLRGYNPSRRLAEGFARAAGLACAGLLVKTRATARQATLGRQGRLENLEGAFMADSRRVAALSGADVILVDDVITTGATFSRAAGILKSAGARSVTGLFLASSTPDGDAVGK